MCGSARSAAGELRLREGSEGKLSPLCLDGIVAMVLEDRVS